MTITFFSKLWMICATFLETFMICYFGENICHQFKELNDVLYQMSWYEWPIVRQRMIPTILMATQHVPVVKGFGNISCSRETYKMVEIQQKFIYIYQFFC